MGYSHAQHANGRARANTTAGLVGASRITTDGRGYNHVKLIQQQNIGRQGRKRSATTSGGTTSREYNRNELTVQQKKGQSKQKSNGNRNRRTTTPGDRPSYENVQATGPSASTSWSGYEMTSTGYEQAEPGNITAPIAPTATYEYNQVNGSARGAGPHLRSGKEGRGGTSSADIGGGGGHALPTAAGGMSRSNRARASGNYGFHDDGGSSGGGGGGDDTGDGRRARKKQLSVYNGFEEEEEV